MELSNQGRSDPSGLKGFKLLETGEKWEKNMEKMGKHAKYIDFYFSS